MVSLRPALFYCFLSGLSFGCSSGCNSEPASQDGPPATQEEPEPSIELSYNTDGSGFTEALAALDGEIEKTAERAAEQTNSWLVRDKLAQLYMARARLSGDYDDYQKAEQTLTEAFALAPEGAGPVLTRAALNFTLHRLDPIEADLSAAEGAILVDDPTRAHILSVRGDVAFQRGQYAEAHTHYLAALELKRSSAILAKLAQWKFRAGEFEAADELFREAADKMLPSSLEGRAWSQLQLGILDLERGRFAEAFAHYRDGTEILGGWWLLEEHIAEIAVLDGRPNSP